MRCSENEKPIGIDCDKLQFANKDAILRKRQMKSGLRRSPSQRRWRNTAAVVTLIGAIAGPSAAVAQAGKPCGAPPGPSIGQKAIGPPGGPRRRASCTGARRPASAAAGEPDGAPR